MTAASGAVSKPTCQKFEDLSSAYRLERAQGIPMSVRERYERRLALLREDLRHQGTSCRMGDVLKRLGAIDEERLADALALQKASGGKKLLGEILVDLGWVDEGKIRQAVEIQMRSAGAPSGPLRR
jgi:hypothetical protein